MRQSQEMAEEQPQTSSLRAEKGVLRDFRFQALLGKDAWETLPQDVRVRFSKRLEAGASVTYAGEIVESHRTRLGRALAQACRLIGSPLPLTDDIGVPAVVTVTEDAATGGQFCTRMYGRQDGFPQIIHSSKRFSGPTGLEEYLGYGFGIMLKVSSDRQALHFHSAGYFLSLGIVRFSIPAWLSPGALTISHSDRGDGTFAFILSLRHPWFGEIISQTALFRERFASMTGGKSCD